VNRRNGESKKHFPKPISVPPFLLFRSVASAFSVSS
jgi:hypothetical protein